MCLHLRILANGSSVRASFSTFVSCGKSRSFYTDETTRSISWRWSPTIWSQYSPFVNLSNMEHSHFSDKSLSGSNSIWLHALRLLRTFGGLLWWFVWVFSGTWSHFCLNGRVLHPQINFIFIGTIIWKKKRRNFGGTNS